MLVVGATGALQPAVRALAARGEIIYAVARPGPRLTALAAELGDSVVPVPADYGNVCALRAAMAVAVPVSSAAGIARAVLYCATAGDDAVSELVRPVRGRVVHVLTSASADPARVGAPAPLPATLPAATGSVRLLLGWHMDAQQDVGATSRWHTPAEISAAALASLDDGRDRTLGTVRPWTDRPS